MASIPKTTRHALPARSPDLRMDRPIKWGDDGRGKGGHTINALHIAEKMDMGESTSVDG